MNDRGGHYSSRLWHLDNCHQAVTTKMAEAFGVFVSTIQMVDLGAKIAFSLSRLTTTRLRHAPETIEKVQQQLQSVTRISEVIEANHMSLQNQSEDAIATLERRIDECSHCLRGLKGIIDPLEQKGSDSRLEKVWRSVVTSRKKLRVKARYPASKQLSQIWYCASLAAICETIQTKRHPFR